jgi:hypothetical protein
VYVIGKVRMKNEKLKKKQKIAMYSRKDSQAGKD